MSDPLHFRSFEAESLVNAPPVELFSVLDDHTRLSAHMESTSWVMLGSRMRLHLDADDGRKVGSRIRITGRVLGIALVVEETITERTPPARKVWETIGQPRLLVIGRYRMGFEITPLGHDSRLRVFIEYALPAGPAQILGFLLGPLYARWCVQRMVRDAVTHFSNRHSIAGYR